ncbi:hypothetical protein ACI1US_01808 [Leucobacter sp. BZR 635]
MGLPINEERRRVLAELQQRHIGGRARIGGIRGSIRSSLSVEVVVAGERAQQRLGEPELAHFRAAARAGALAGALADLGDQAILAVCHEHVSRRVGDALQVSRGGVDLAEAVELIPQHVEQQREARLHPLDEEHCVRLVEFEHGDIGVEFAADGALFDHRCDDAAGEVRSGAVREDLQALGLEHLDDHLGGGRLTVGAAHGDDAERQTVEAAAHEAGVEALDDEAGQRGSAAPKPRHRAHRLADRRREKITHGSRLLAQEVWPHAPRPFDALLVPPLLNHRVVSGEQHIGDTPATPLGGLGVARVLE